MLTSSIEWNIEPADMRVHIQSNSVDLGAVFVITGFNLHGFVYDENRTFFCGCIMARQTCEECVYWC